MKLLSKNTFALSVTLLTLSTAVQASQVPAKLQPIQQNALCELTGLLCPTITPETSGKGKEPDLKKKTG